MPLGVLGASCISSITIVIAIVTIHFFAKLVPCFVVIGQWRSVSFGLIYELLVFGRSAASWRLFLTLLDRIADIDAIPDRG